MNCRKLFAESDQGAMDFFYNNFSNDYLIITNYHVISPKTVNLNPIITIKIYNKKTIELNLKQRNIKFLKEPFDITAIEINDVNELLCSIKFLKIDLNYKNGYQIYLNKEVFALGYHFDDNFECTSGKISSISGSEFKHECKTGRYSSGSPIILATNLKVVGIHTITDGIYIQ